MSYVLQLCIAVSRVTIPVNSNKNTFWGGHGTEAKVCSKSDITLSCKRL
jgi:hypothetical protein